MTDLKARVLFLNKWIDKGIPASFWISGFFFPQAFLTGCLQNYARRNTISIDTIQYGFKVLDKKYDKRPAYGCIIHGLFLEGCRWNEQTHTLDESKSKILYTGFYSFRNLEQNILEIQNNLLMHLKLFTINYRNVSHMVDTRTTSQT